MPLLDIATAQSSFQNNIFRSGARSLFHNEFLGVGNERRLASGWKAFQVPMKGKRFDVEGNKMQRSSPLIKAAAALESNCSVKINGGDQGVGSLQMAKIHHQSPGEEKEVDKRERLRRTRISKANKGNTPWNKGRKHSAETLKRIKERTRQAMQDPKVKMKLVNLGHAQSEETRMKIGVGVRMGWERRREKLRLQETCYFKWQNLIAEASRRGFVGEEELQWDSYMSLDEQLEKEWLESVEQRKEMAKAKGNRRAPKSLEQRRKISESISAKWADPAYRDRVCSGLAKYFGMPVGAERKPKRRTSGERQPRTQSATKKVSKDTCKSLGNGAKSHSSRGRRRHMPMFNPLASSQLEMIKNIRAQRAAAENKTTEAIEQAKLLIAEAEKAAKALETAAMRSPLARNSLIETRKLIAEALQSIRSIDTGQNDSYGVESNPNYQSLAHGVESNPNYHNLSQKDREEVNGIQTVDLGEINVGDFGFGKLNFQDYVNSKGEVLVNGKESKEALYQTGKDYRGFVSMDFGSVVKQQSFIGQLSQFETDGINSQDKKLLINGSGLSAFRSRREKEEAPPDSTTRTKKWVRGKLVEMVEGE